MTGKTLMKKILTFILTLSMVLSNFTTPVYAVDNEPIDDDDTLLEDDVDIDTKTTLARDEFESDHPDALHFYIRHWHTEDVDENDTIYQNGATKSVGRYFIIVEGYIVPEKKGDDNFEFYFVY